MGVYCKYLYAQLQVSEELAGEENVSQINKSGNPELTEDADSKGIHKQHYLLVLFLSRINMPQVCF